MWLDYCRSSRTRQDFDGGLAFHAACCSEGWLLGFAERPGLFCCGSGGAFANGQRWRLLLFGLPFPRAQAISKALRLALCMVQREAQGGALRRRFTMRHDAVLAAFERDLHDLQMPFRTKDTCRRSHFSQQLLDPFDPFLSTLLSGFPDLYLPASELDFHNSPPLIFNPHSIIYPHQGQHCGPCCGMARTRKPMTMDCSGMRSGGEQTLSGFQSYLLERPYNMTADTRG
uniref:Uncharacterized protein n=1 Tax=mine drainage metagenome TaxID=410659 RepID=E6QIU5_9ZZZZ